jgi:uncharacterized protein (DUF58 family)
MSPRPRPVVPLPSKGCIGILFAAGVAALAQLLGGVDVQAVAGEAMAGAAILLAFGLVDYAVTCRRWFSEPLLAQRKLPAAFAIGVTHGATLTLQNGGPRGWRGVVFDGIDPKFRLVGMPRPFRLGPRQSTAIEYTLTAGERGLVYFAPAQIRLRSAFGLLDLKLELAGTARRRVYPNFAAVARFAWLAGNRRLTDVGITAVRQRGSGTDFKQLAEYHKGDPIRHVDWKASLRHEKPIVREFQDERDQCIMFMIDCGRRMRADDVESGVGAGHFEQALNAMVLLSYVALSKGDSVGVMTFGTPPESKRLFAPRKGVHALDAMMAAIGDVQPSLTYSDYSAAATELMQRHRKRSLVVLITNFRDEDVSELAPSLRLLRSRHLVMLASLREKVVREIVDRSEMTPANSLLVASAHLYEQSRRDAFRRLAARDALMVDTEPARLGVELVNRYQGAKRAGLI